jgi:hypothetical protein
MVQLDFSGICPFNKYMDSNVTKAMLLDATPAKEQTNHTILED